jgi:hypothetical protein
VAVCTPSEFRVNEKLALATACVFNRVQPVHRPLTGFGANARTASYRKANLNSPAITDTASSRVVLDRGFFRRVGSQIQRVFARQSRVGLFWSGEEGGEMRQARETCLVEPLRACPGQQERDCSTIGCWPRSREWLACATERSSERTSSRGERC